jgi:uncharacterized membrane protein YfcA
MSTLVLLIVVCCLTYSFEIVFGLAGTIMMLFVMTFFMPTKTLVIYSLLPQIMVATIGLARSPKTVQIIFLWRMLMFALVGSVLGLVLFYAFPPRVFNFVLAGLITLFGLFLVAVPGRIRFNALTARLLDVVAGMSQSLIGISGPVAMTRLLGSFDDKLQVRNYALAFFLSLNLVRAAGYLVQGSITRDIVEMMLISAPFLGVTLWYANHLHFRVNETLFRRVVSWIILLGGIALLFNFAQA